MRERNTICRLFDEILYEVKTITVTAKPDNFVSHMFVSSLQMTLVIPSDFHSESMIYIHRVTMTGSCQPSVSLDELPVTVTGSNHSSLMPSDIRESSFVFVADNQRRLSGFQ